MANKHLQNFLSLPCADSQEPNIYFSREYMTRTKQKIHPNSAARPAVSRKKMAAWKYVVFQAVQVIRRGRLRWKFLFFRPSPSERNDVSTTHSGLPIIFSVKLNQFDTFPGGCGHFQISALTYMSFDPTKLELTRVALLGATLSEFVCPFVGWQPCFPSLPSFSFPPPCLYFFSSGKNFFRSLIFLFFPCLSYQGFHRERQAGRGRSQLILPVANLDIGRLLAGNV